MTSITARGMLGIAETVLSLGLNRVIARFAPNPRWRHAVWLLIALNEARGIAVAFEALKHGALWILCP